MSQENVELVRSIVEAWNRGDYSVALELDARHGVYRPNRENRAG